MSKFSIITGSVSFLFLFATIGIFSANITVGIVFAVITTLFALPSIIEDRYRSDYEYEERIEDELNY